MCQISSSVAQLKPERIRCDTLKNGPPASLHGGEGALHNDYFVVCGGMQGAKGKERKQCKRLQLGSDKWEEDEPLPEPRLFCC